MSEISKIPRCCERQARRKRPTLEEVAKKFIPGFVGIVLEEQNKLEELQFLFPDGLMCNTCGLGNRPRGEYGGCICGAGRWVPVFYNGKPLTEYMGAAHPVSSPEKGSE